MGDVTFRTATEGDLAAVLSLLADDALGGAREVEEMGPYALAFAEIDADPNHQLVVGDLDGEVVAVLQLTFLPCLTHGGRRRAQIEGVRVASSLRGKGVGRALIAWAVDRARTVGCGVVQLTTDTSRPDALRFYKSLGFRPTHVGLKLDLPTRSRP